MRGSPVFFNGLSKEHVYLVPIIQSYTDNVYSTYQYTSVSLPQTVGGGMGVSLSFSLGQTSLGQT